MLRGWNAPGLWQPSKCRCSPRATSTQALYPTRTQALDLARFGGYAYFNDGSSLMLDAAPDTDAWGARARARAADGQWNQVHPQVVPSMEVG